MTTGPKIPGVVIPRSVFTQPGSFATNQYAAFSGRISALRRKRTNSRSSRYVRFVPIATIGASQRTVALCRQPTFSIGGTGAVFVASAVPLRAGRRTMSHQALPDEAVDLSLAKQGYGRRLEYQSITSELKEPLLLRPNPVWKPAQLEAMNDETLLFVDFVGTAVADVSLKAALDFLRCGLRQMAGGKVQTIGTHERHAHLSSRIVHDAPKGIGSQRRVGQITVGPCNFPRHELPCAKELFLDRARGRPVRPERHPGGESGGCGERHGEPHVDLFDD